MSSSLLTTLNTATVRTNDVISQVGIAAASDFEGIGLWISDIEAYVARGGTIADIREAANEAEIAISEICYLPLFGPSPDTYDTDLTARSIEIAERLDCPILVGVPAQTNSPMSDLDPRVIADICELGAKQSVRIALEYGCTAKSVNTLQSALKAVRAANAANFGVLVDLFHTFVSGSDLRSLAAETKKHLMFVHISDAMNVSGEELLAFHDNRTLPGKGIIDLECELSVLDEIGYRGHYSLEVWNQTPLTPSDKETALVARDRMRALLG